MKDFSHKVGAVIMTIMVLFTTMSFSMDMHFCGDNLVDFKLYQKAAGCDMNMSMKGMDMNMDEKHCCTDLALIIPGQDDLQASFEVLSFEQQTFLVSFVVSHFQILSVEEERIDPFRDYAPPPLIRDVQVLDQTFLI